LIQISNVNDVSLRTVAVRGSARATKDIWRDDPFVTRLRNFVDLTLPDLQSLRAVIEVEQSVKKRRDLVHDGYEYCKLCFVKDGFAARYKLLRNGRRQIVDFVLPGDVVGLPGSFLDRAAHSVLAVSDMKLQVCSLEAFVALCFRRPKFGLALSWLAAQEAVNYAERIIDIGRRTPLERLAHLLLEIHSRLAMVGCAEEAVLQPAVHAGDDERRARTERAAPQPHAHQAAQRGPDRRERTARGIRRSQSAATARAVSAGPPGTHSVACGR